MKIYSILLIASTVPKTTAAPFFGAAVIAGNRGELLHADFAVFLAEFLKGEGSLADAGLGCLVADLVDVSLDGIELLFDLGDNRFHTV